MKVRHVAIVTEGGDALFCKSLAAFSPSPPEPALKKLVRAVTKLVWGEKQ